MGHEALLKGQSHEDVFDVDVLGDAVAHSRLDGLPPFVRSGAVLSEGCCQLFSSLVDKSVGCANVNDLATFVIIEKAVEDQVLL